MDFFSKILFWFIRQTLPFWVGQQVDREQLVRIAGLKLLMDNRRPNSYHLTQQKKKAKPISKAALGVFAGALFTGLLLCLLMFVGANLATGVVVWCTMFLFMCTTMLVSDFSSILFDGRDNNIVLPTPVSDATLLAARLVHILVAVLRISLPLSLPGLVLLGFRSSLAGALAMLPMVLLMTLLAVFIVNLLYVAALRFTTAQRFQSMVAWLQIVLSVLIYGAVQLGSRAMDKIHIMLLDLTGPSPGWRHMNPGAWFGLGWHQLRTLGSEGWPGWVGLLLCLALPALGLYLMLSVLGPGFNQKLAMSGTGSGGEEVGQKAKASAGSWVKVLARWICRPGLERQVFLATWRISGRSKDFKLKVYPSIGYMLVYAVVMLLRMDGLSAKVSSGNPQTLQIIMLASMYSFTLVMITALGQMPFSQYYKASWVYYSHPLEKPGRIHTAVYKMLCVKFYLPLIVPVLAFSLWAGGWALLPNLLLTVVNMLLITQFIAYLRNRHLPFSLPQGNVNDSAGCLYSLLYFIIPSAFGVLHYFVYWYWPLVVAGIVLSSIALWLMYGKLSKASFHNLDQPVEA